MRADALPLPPYRHVPGRTGRPDEAFFEAVRDGIRASTVSETEAAKVTWLYGLRLFNEGFYWEAHEMLEPIWLGAAPRSRERHLVQAVIHLANGMLKQEMGRPGARERIAGLCQKAIAEAFSGKGGTLMGMEYTAAEKAARDLAEHRSPIYLFAESEI